MLVDTRTPGQSFVYDDFSISALSRECTGDGERPVPLSLAARD
jgi:hypothetical protein